MFFRIFPPVCESSALMWADDKAGTGISTGTTQLHPSSWCWPRHRQNCRAQSNPVRRYAMTLRSYKSPFIQVNPAHIFWRIILFSHVLTSTNICMETFPAGNHHLLQTLVSCVWIVSDPSKLISDLYLNSVPIQRNISQEKVFEILLLSTKLYLGTSQFNESCKKCDCLSLLSMDRNLRARLDVLTAASIT